MGKVISVLSVSDGNIKIFRIANLIEGLCNIYSGAYYQDSAVLGEIKEIAVVCNSCCTE